MVGVMATPHQVSDSGLGRFPDDRFGMFVHWGLYSLIGADGWGMFRERHSIDEYEKIALRFKAAGRSDGLVSTVQLELS
jgi:hypothetical protein